LGGTKRRFFLDVCGKPGGMKNPAPVTWAGKKGKGEKEKKKGGVRRSSSTQAKEGKGGREERHKKKQPC